MNELCSQVSENIASVLEGDASDELYAHIADCSDCRDLKHDAELAAKKVGAASADFVMPRDMEERVIRKIEANAIVSEPVAYPPPPPPPPEVVAQATGSNENAAVSATPNAEIVPKDDAASKLEAVLDRRTTKSSRETLADRRANRFTIAAVSGAALLLAAGVILSIDGSKVDERSASVGDPWQGEVAAIEGESSGLEICDGKSSACRAAKAGDKIGVGAKIRVASKTTAGLRFADGTAIALDRDSELELRDKRGRFARLNRGIALADVAHIDDSVAEIEVPGGVVRVIGTKFEMFAGDRESRVNVTRGTVELASNSRKELVNRGEEGVLTSSGDVTVFASLRSPDERLLGSRTDANDGERAAPGLGELRAKKPGQNDEKIGAVHLARHDVHVRVSDMMARTEIDETFSNTTGDELEGLFRFPLPPDAQIERLALEVDGKLVEAAFVEKDKAAAIWRGVIQHATPNMPKPKEEIIWVPGPWRDPALLEWKRGGRFELKIFPIPAHGSRRVVLSYTQLVPATAGARRYTYPLPQSGAGLTRVDEVNFDVRVAGAEKGSVKARGYGASTADDNGSDSIRFSQPGFLPSGDFSIDYSPREKAREITTYGYAASGEDAQPFGVIALRPNLPRNKEEGYRDHVIVVDTSRSMFGERFAQANRLVGAAIEEMDPRDRVTVLTCDAACREMPGGLAFVGAPVKASALRFLAQTTPDGSSNLLAMAKSAISAGKNAPAVKPTGWFKSGDASQRSVHMIYIGDGSASSGPVVARHLAGEVQRVFSGTDATLTTVAVGQDADTRLLGAYARAGGGTLLPFVPGESTRVIGAKIALAASGARIKNATLTLPEGLVTATGADLGTVRAGSESFIGVRMTRPEVEGEAVLRGTLGGQYFERKFPIKITAANDAGNAFVPRLYAAMRMQELEERGGSDAKNEITTLSKRYHLASPYTSLLVLESQAMFDAFKLDRNQDVATWTGEDEMHGTAGGENSQAEGESSDSRNKDLGAMLDKGAATGSATGALGFGLSGSGQGGGGRAELGRASESKSKAPSAMDAYGDSPATNFAGPKMEEAAKRAPAPVATAVPPMPPPVTMAQPQERPRDDIAMPRRRPPVNPGGRMVPMKRVWDRQGYVRSDVVEWKSKSQTVLFAAENKAATSPDSRDAAKGLYSAVARFGDLPRAHTLADQWAARDALDIDALLARADVAAREGDREKAVRILGGAVDVRRDDPALQNRLSDVYARLANPEQACAHRITLAEERSSDPSVVARAVVCSQATGKRELSDILSGDVPQDKRAAFTQALAKAPNGPDNNLGGDVRVSGNWSSGEDLDIALIDPNGVRISWLGGRTTLGAEGTTTGGHEVFAVSALKPGSYIVEVTRTKSGYSPMVSGELEILAVGDSRPANASGGERRRIPFTLSGPSVQVARIEIGYTSHLVEAWDVATPRPPENPKFRLLTPPTNNGNVDPWSGGGRPFNE